MLRPSSTALVALFLALAARPAFAGKFNETLSLGDAGPAWTKLPGTDGKEHSLSDLKDREAVVVVFTCNSCPYAVEYEERLIAFAKKHCGPDGKVALVAINVNRVPEDSLEEMTKRAKEQKFNYAYLFDESQKIAKDYGATFTPEFYVLDRARKVVYMGAMDDSTDASKVTARHVEEAVAATLAGRKPKLEETAARGCLVRYARERRRP